MYTALTIIACVFLICLVIVVCSIIDYKKSKNTTTDSINAAKKELIEAIKSAKMNQY